MALGAVEVPPKPSRTKRKTQREWAPRIWQGLNFYAWLRLLFKHRAAITWRQAHTAAIITVVSIGHSILGLVELLWYRRRVPRTPFANAPIFIIGHWRTGTTLLHELLTLDPEHTYPTTYECLEPNHFLLTEWFFRRWGGLLMPSHRPMDNMESGWDRPQEDEFALCMLGQPSPYLTIAFPNHAPSDPDFLDLESVSAGALGAWKRDFLWFLRRVAFRRPGRLVLKSPTHTCRIKVLLELFPDARFVHIVRDPYVVFPSTAHLWKSLYEMHGLQIPDFKSLDEYVFSGFTHLYDRLEATAGIVRPERFHEVRYEDLVSDPVGQMRALYEGLELDSFEQLLPKLEQYQNKHADYQTNQYDLTPETRAEINRRWGRIIRRLGYAPANAS
jgi:hypothetical protein